MVCLHKFSPGHKITSVLNFFGCIKHREQLVSDKIIRHCLGGIYIILKTEGYL